MTEFPTKQVKIILKDIIKLIITEWNKIFMVNALIQVFHEHRYYFIAML